MTRRRTHNRRPTGHTARRQVDHRVVYGARCSWWDSIRKASVTPAGVPCCPHCRGVLFEVASERDWWPGVEAHEADGHPYYRAFVEWMRGRCYPNYELARAAWLAG